MNTVPFFAIRHGETEWNRQGRFQGHADIPLAPQSCDRLLNGCGLLASLLARRGIVARDLRVIASPLMRCMQTARLVCDVLSLDPDGIAVDARLREQSFGDWEGLTTHEVKAAYPEARRARKTDRWNFAPPGGQSPADIARRMDELLNELATGKIPLLVTHSGNIRALYWLLAGTPAAQAAEMAVPHGSVFSWDGTVLSRDDPAAAGNWRPAAAGEGEV